LGAYYGYQEVSKEISKYFPNVKTRKLDDFVVDEEYGVKLNGTANMITFRGSNEKYYNLTPIVSYSYVNTTNGRDEKDILIFRNRNDSLPRAVIFRDSFMTSAKTYLSDDLSVAAYIWSPWDEKFDIRPWLWKIKPQIVIEERVERYLVSGVGL
jgi:hypothetical protein